MRFFRIQKYDNSAISQKKNNAGRNNTGRITIAHQGGGHKQSYRTINLQGTAPKGWIIGLEYDPNRSARIAKIGYLENNVLKFYYILAPQNLILLDQVETYSKKSVLNNAFQFNVKKQIGSFYKLTEFERGDSIYNIELWPNTGAKLVRAGGTFAQVLNKDKNFLTVKLPSKEHRLIPIDCKACFGSLSNENNRTTNWKKAGKSRWLNKRPTVRGVAKNPVDHPHGGNTSGGCHPVTPWARLTKGRPTRSKKKINKLILKKNSR